MKQESKKQTYSIPRIEHVKLDNEISLVLESPISNPGEPGVFNSLPTDYFNNNPLKNYIG